MDVKQVQGFIAVVEQGSFSKAAELTFISPQALQQQMNSFEAEVGTKLFVRSPRGVQCTPAGQFLYERCKTLDKYRLDILAECRRIGNESGSSLSIAVSSLPIFLTTTCRAFRTSHPGIELVEVDAELDRAAELLDTGTVELFEVGRTPRAELLAQRGLLYMQVARFQPMCVVSSDHPLAERETVEPHDLVGLRVGTRDGGLFPGDSAFDAVRDAIDVLEEPLGRDEAIRLCLEGGVFVAHLPSTARLFPTVAIPLCHESIEAGLVIRADASPNTLAFVDVAKAAFSSTGAA